MEKPCIESLLHRHLKCYYLLQSKKKTTEGWDSWKCHCFWVKWSVIQQCLWWLVHPGIVHKGYIHFPTVNVTVTCGVIFFHGWFLSWVASMLVHWLIKLGLLFEGIGNDFHHSVLLASDMHIKYKSFIDARVLHTQFIIDIVNSWRDDTQVCPASSWLRTSF